MSDNTSTDTRKHFPRLAEMAALVGEHLATSPWITVDQQRINLFADATGDHQWIHVDVERAKAGPYGAPIAHGFLTLSLLPELNASAMVIDDVKMSINYGLNKVRFTGPVPAGSRVRAQIKLKAYDVIEGGAQMTTEVTIEREGATKPVCVAEAVSRRFT
ncbi:MAG TPA: MaoC family dehydratase [Aquabacterium sp.]|nr:MaoC family dehydratase [Aquabacterium sp.]HQC96813.1 MaoC family dehydratase [Aquabacterium sp.]